MDKFEKPRGYKNLNSSESKPNEPSLYQKLINFVSYYFGYNTTPQIEPK